MVFFKAQKQIRVYRYEITEYNRVMTTFLHTRVLQYTVVFTFIHVPVSHVCKKCTVCAYFYTNILVLEYVTYYIFGCRYCIVDD